LTTSGMMITEKCRKHYAKASVELRQHLVCSLTVHYQGQQIAHFDQVEGLPLRIGIFVPEPELPINLDFIPDPIPVEANQL